MENSPLLGITNWITTIVSWITTYYTVLLVLGTWVAIIVSIFVAYHFRPIKLEVRKIHSDDLKRLVKDWIDQIPLPEMVTKVIVDEPKFIEILVEKEYLFSDLRNHMPRELNLFKVWLNYKEKLYQYKLRLYALFQDINHESAKYIGLFFGNKPEALISLCTQTYVYVFNVAEGKGKGTEYAIFHVLSKNIYELVFNGAVIATSINKELLKVVQFVHQNWIEELNGESEIIEEAKELISLKQQLNTDAKKLERELNEYARIPILPKKCKYISWSLSGYLETIKLILKKLISMRHRRSND